jgi:hypothetical protein
VAREQSHRTGPSGLPRSSAVGADPIFAAVGHFNGDGHLDLAVANSAANTISILLGLGNGTLMPAVDYPVGTRSTAPVPGGLQRGT